MPKPIRTGAWLAAVLALAGCGGHDRRQTDTETATINFGGLDAAANGSDAQTVAVSVPGFSAKLSVPGLSLGATSTEIDGLHFHPGTKLTGMNVTGKAGDGTGGEGHGTVDIRFTDPAAPAALLDYYRNAAAGAGWRVVPPAAGAQFAATKPGDTGETQLSLYVEPAGAGSTGRFLVTGG